MIPVDAPDSGTLAEMARDKSLLLRLSAEEREAWQAAAEADQRKLSDWIRVTLNAVAKPKPPTKPKPKRRAR